MPAFVVELLEEEFELSLLLQQVRARRPGGLVFERQVDALVATILLRLARLDGLDADAQP